MSKALLDKLLKIAENQQKIIMKLAQAQTAEVMNKGNVGWSDEVFKALKADPKFQEGLNSLLVNQNGEKAVVKGSFNANKIKSQELRKAVLEKLQKTEKEVDFSALYGEF